MTGYTVHTGSNENFSQGWDAIFSKGTGAKKATAKKPVAKPSKKAEGAKKAAKGTSKKKK